MKRAAFVTIGQAPRHDILSEMRPRIGDSVAIEEFGVLDELTPEQIGELEPGQDDERLVTRLRDESEVVVQKPAIEERLHALIERLDRESYDMLIVLCTGEFGNAASNTLVVSSQAVVDHGLAAVATGARTIGILVPLPAQIAHVQFAPGADQRVVASHADPYTGSRFELAAEELADADLIVMHCMGYTEAQRRAVARASGRPVLLARRMVADAVAQLV